MFAQLVLALEDLARMVEYKIYDLGVWVKGMLYLPPVLDLPECFSKLGFSGNILPTVEDIKARYKILAKERHPDTPGGSNDTFNELMEAVNNCLHYIDSQHR